MKKLNLLFTAILLLCCVGNANAEEVTINGIKYDVNTDTKQATVIKGSSYSGDIVIPSDITYNNVTCSVTSIGDDAFYGCNAITSITIPNSVTSIGSYAFQYCSSLNAVHISDLTAWCSINFGNYANPLYYAHNLYLDNELVTELVIPDGITNIGWYAFNGCSELTSITIPNSVTHIEHYAFRGCSRITSIKIPNSVTWIGDYAFGGWTSLKEVVIEDGEDELVLGYNWSENQGLFNDCPLETLYLGRNINIVNPDTGDGFPPFCNNTTLSSVIIGQCVTNIVDDLFKDCSNLTSVVISKNITNIGQNAFSGCVGLKEVHINDLAAWCSINWGSYTANPLYYAHNLYFNNELVTELVIPSSVTKINDYTFYNCSSLASFTIPNSVTSIGERAFSGTTWYDNQPVGVVYTGKVLYEYKGTMPENTSIIVKEGTIGIVGRAFENCAGLTSITIPNSVTNIGNSAFLYCSNLTSITIPNSVINIEQNAFSGCVGLKEVHINDLAAWCSINWGSYTANPLYYAHNLYFNNELVTELVIPSSVTKINDYTFYNCSGLTSITISNSVTSIGEGAFTGCTLLKDLHIENGETTLSLGYYGATGKGLFYDCPLKTLYVGRNLSYNTDYNHGYSPFCEKRTLTSVTIGNSVTSIGNNAFEHCKGLTSITIPNSVTSIGDDAFYGCSGLEGIVVDPDNTMYDSRDNCNAIIETESKTLLYGCKNTVIPNSVTSIGGGAFYGCSALTSITIPNSVISIGESAFNGCEELKQVINFSNLTFNKGSSSNGYIAYYANEVYNAPYGSIDGDYIFGKPNNVNTLLYYLGNESELTLPADYIGEGYAIGENVFKDNKTITSIIIPNSVTSIRNNAFYGCEGLRSITIGSSVASIGNQAFARCVSLKELSFEDGTEILNLGYNKLGNDTYLGEGLFYDCPLQTLYLGRNLEYEKNERFGKTPFYNNEDLTFVTVGKYVTNIEDGLLNYCRLEKVGLNCENVATWFSGWITIREVIVGENVKTIDYDAFDGLLMLKNVELNCQTVDSWFRGMSSIKKVVVGENVKSIKDKSFLGCYALRTVINKSNLDIVNGAETHGYVAYYADDVINEQTNIEDIKAENSNVKAIYDLQGRYVETPKNGIYIINGKKVLVK